MAKTKEKPLLNLDADPKNADWIKWRTPDVDSLGRVIIPKMHPNSGKVRITNKKEK